MARLTWHEEALADLDEIGQFIARDSPRFARRLVQRVFDAADRLVEFPRSGRIVPEIGRDDIREIIVGSHRVMYQVRSDEIEVVAVLHGARQLNLRKDS